MHTPSSSEFKGACARSKLLFYFCNFFFESETLRIQNVFLDIKKEN